MLLMIFFVGIVVRRLRVFIHVHPRESLHSLHQTGFVGSDNPQRKKPRMPSPV